MSKNYPKIEFAPVNRNFLHYPLARSFRGPLKIRERVRLTSSPYAIIVLHRDAKCGTDGKPRATVWLRIPTRLLVTRPDMARAPTRFDIDVLLRLLAISVMGKGKIIHEQAFARGKKAIIETKKKRQQKTLFHRHHNRNKSDETFMLALKGGDSYMAAIDAALGKPNRHVERAAGKAAYKEADQRLRRVIPGNPVLKFRSMRQLLASLGRAVNKPGNYRSVEDSLIYLSSVEVRFAKWYVGGGHDEAQREKRTIRFLDSIDYAADRTVVIFVSPEFLSTTCSYFAKVPLPLPLSSESAQNLELWLHAFHPFYLERKVCPQFQRFCDKLGIPATSPAEASASLSRSLDQVNKHRTQREEAERLRIQSDPKRGTISFKRIHRIKRKADDFYAP
ncbi:hypothetical protein ACC718_14935 [Rhizobium ruizarguesonis]